MSFAAYAEKYLPFVERALETYLPPETDVPSTIHRAMRYSALGGGKRLRALLVIAGCEAVGGDVSKLPPLVAAVELIHAYSLVHDDLPCMDDDDYRRGKPTNHKVFGEAIAVLTGDALLTLGFCLLARLQEMGVPDRAIVRVLRELGEAAGTYGLVGGQVVDIESEGKRVCRETLEYTHTHKTGALFRAAVCSGAIVGGAGEGELTRISVFADRFGLAFQITDDILDVVGNEAKLGKAVGSDERHVKATYVSMFGLEKARLMAEQAAAEAVAAVNPLGSRAQPLVDMTEFILVRDH